MSHTPTLSRSRDRVHGSDGVAGGFGVVAAPGRGGPAEGAVGELVDVPAGVLLEPVVVAAFGAGVAQAGAAARLMSIGGMEVTM